MKKILTIPMLASMFLATGQAHAAKTLVYCSEGSPEIFNAALVTAGTTLDASSRQIYNRLAEFEIGTTNIIPGLAERWTISEDGKEYTFFLRKGVKFHTAKYFVPSRDFNADDILFTFNRQLKKDHSYHTVNGGTYEYFEGVGMGSLIEDIVKIDDYTVKFILNRPESPFIANLAMDFASITSAEYAEQQEQKGNKEAYDHLPIGTGPFQFVAYQKDAVIRYKANPDYFKGKAPIDRLIFAITPDSTVRFQKLKAGECHVTLNPNPNDLDEMKKTEGLTVMQQEGLNVGYLGYNTEKPPFNIPEVRRALNMAINKNAIIESVFNGVGQVAKNPIPPTIWSYNKNTIDDVYDPVAAKELLEKSGVTKLKTNIWAMPVQRPYNPNARRMAELIQADWKAIGVDAEIVTYEWGEYLKRSNNGEHDTILMGWTGDNGDPDNFMNVLLSCDAAKAGSNRARWCNKSFDDLLIKAKKSSDIEERTKLYEQAQLIFKKEAPWATIAHSIVSQPIRNEVKNFKIDPLGGNFFYGVDIEN